MLHLSQLHGRRLAAHVDLVEGLSDNFVTEEPGDLFECLALGFRKEEKEHYRGDEVARDVDAVVSIGKRMVSIQLIDGFT